MDIEFADRLPIRQATERDLHDVFAADFSASVTLARNYGDRLEAIALPDGSYRLEYYEAATGRRQQAEAPLGVEQVKDACWDFFHGHWNWHQRHGWRTL